MEIYYSPKFIKSYKKLPVEVRRLAENKEKIFVKNPLDSKLKSHKLHGDFVGFWSFSVNKSYRIIFDFIGESIVRFYDVGTHEIYK